MSDLIPIKPRKNGIPLLFVLFLGILSVSTASILIRFAQKEVPSLTIAALRLTFASLILIPVVINHFRVERYTLLRHELLLGVISGFFLAIHFATWITSLEYTTVASSVVLVSTGPLWVALLSPILLKEKLTRVTKFGLGLTLLGGALISLSDACVWEQGLYCPSLSNLFHGQAMWGNFLALMGAWAVTGYLIIGRHLRKTVSLILYIFIVYSAAALILIALMLLSGESPFGYEPVSYIWLLLLALLPQLIGHSIYNWALRFLPVSFVSITTLGEPIGSVILAYFILFEKPSPAILIGGILILTGIYLASKQSLETNPTEKEAQVQLK